MNIRGGIFSKQGDQRQSQGLKRSSSSELSYVIETPLFKPYSTPIPLLQTPLTQPLHTLLLTPFSPVPDDSQPNLFSFFLSTGSIRQSGFFGTSSISTIQLFLVLNFISQLPLIISIRPGIVCLYALLFSSLILEYLQSQQSPSSSNQYKNTSLIFLFKYICQILRLLYDPSLGKSSLTSLSNSLKSVLLCSNKRPIPLLRSITLGFRWLMMSLKLSGVKQSSTNILKGLQMFLIMFFILCFFLWGVSGCRDTLDLSWQRGWLLVQLNSGEGSICLDYWGVVSMGTGTGGEGRMGVRLKMEYAHFFPFGSIYSICVCLRSITCWFTPWCAPLMN